MNIENNDINMYILISHMQTKYIMSDVWMKISHDANLLKQWVLCFSSNKNKLEKNL